MAPVAVLEARLEGARGWRVSPATAGWSSTAGRPRLARAIAELEREHQALQVKVPALQRSRAR